MFELGPANEFGMAKDFEAIRGVHVSPNDEVERRGAAPTSNNAALSQSSTPLLRSPKMQLPRSLEPIVRRFEPQHRLICYLQDQYMASARESRSLHRTAEGG
jgi:hypothetical protein